mgnify:CR=1 FL=1
MMKQRILLFCTLLLLVLLVPCLLPLLLWGSMLPLWAYLLYWTIVLIIAGVYLVNRCYLVDHFLVEGKWLPFVGWNLLLILAGAILQRLAVVFFEQFSDGAADAAMDLTARISQIVLGIVLEVVAVIVAVAISMSDQWRYASYRYKDALRANEGLQKDVSSLQGQVDALRRQRSAPSPTSISVKVNLVMTQVPLEEILYVKADGDYVLIHKADGTTLMTLLTLKALERQLPFDRFCRTHRSYVVNVDKVSGIKDGKLQVGGETVPLSDSCKGAFFEILSHKSIILSQE